MKNLVIYFSRADQNYVGGELKTLQKGNTEVIAEMIAKEVGADLFKVESEKPYPQEYYACCDQAKDELYRGSRPKLKKMLDSIEEYDNIFIGYPIWWGTLPMPMFTQLEKLDFRGKHVLPYSTHEGSRLGKSMSDIEKLCKGAVIAQGLAIQGCNAPNSKSTVATWAKEGVK